MSLSQIDHIRIHPGIGIARVGNSPEQSFIGPEAPGIVSDPGGSGGQGPDGGTYKDSQQRMKRQAQRFRIYGYDKDGKVVAEIDGSNADVSSIEWKVHVRNMKAANYAFQGAYLFDPTKLRNPSIQPGIDPIQRDKLIIDPGVRTIATGATQPVSLVGKIFDKVGPNGDGTGLTLPGYLKFNPPQPSPPQDDVPVTYRSADVCLGELSLDDKQRLLFEPGYGISECLTTPAIDLSNPSETYNPPNGPDEAEDDPLVNQFSYFNVPGWYDDTCGGSIDATVKLSDGTVLSTLVNPGTPNESREPTRGAWVVVAPPKYAPWMYHVVSILDRVYETFPEADPTQGLPTVFYRDVYPILQMATNYAWVSAEAYGPQGTAHGPGQPGDLLSEQNMKAFTDPGPAGSAARQGIYNIMRHAEENFPPPPPTAAPPPRKAGTGPASRGNFMPKLWGTGGKPLQNEQLGNNLPNQYLSLTPAQLARMKDWAEGNFTVGTPIVPQPLDKLPLAEQPNAMDVAALQPTIGGGFHPGIEFPYLILYREFFAEAFRVAKDVEPGSVAAYMSCPWQGDFWSCNTAWWPVQRPDIVVEYDNEKMRTKEWFRGFSPVTGEPLSQDDGYNQMVSVWWQLGMVVSTSRTDQGETVFQEAERDPALDKPPTDKS